MICQLRDQASAQLLFAVNLSYLWSYCQVMTLHLMKTMGQHYLYYIVYWAHKMYIGAIYVVYIYMYIYIHGVAISSQLTVKFDMQGCLSKFQILSLKFSAF